MLFEWEEIILRKWNQSLVTFPEKIKSKHTAITKIQKTYYHSNSRNRSEVWTDRFQNHGIIKFEKDKDPICHNHTTKHSICLRKKEKKKKPQRTLQHLQTALWSWATMCHEVLGVKKVLAHTLPRHCKLNLCPPFVQGFILRPWHNVLP